MRSIVSVLFLTFFLLASAFADDQHAPQLVIKTPMANGSEVVITAEEFGESSPEKIKELLLDQRVRSSDVLLSTDQPAVVDAAMQATASPSDTRLLRIIPIGKIKDGFKSYIKNAKNTLRTDRIGLTVLSITAGVDSYIWIHSATLDIHQKTAMVMMNLVMAATFGLDRELWTKISSPLKHSLIKTFDRFLITERFSKFKTMTAAFTANMFIGIGIQLTRTGLLSIDHITQTVTTMDFWSNAIKLSGLITLTGFTWSEVYGGIDAEKNPVAKMMMKRLSETRGIILAQLASISMVLQPHIYGHMPIYTYLVHGAVGLVVFMNAHRVVQWLEHNRTVNRIYRKVQTFENFINSELGVKPTKAAAGSCRALLAG